LTQIKQQEENTMGDLISETTKPVLETSPGKSLIQEVQLLREQVADLCKATRGLVTLISVLDKKVDTALKGGVGADFAVL
jgi:hypothetical protein